MGVGYMLYVGMVLLLQCCTMADTIVLFQQLPCVVPGVGIGTLQSLFVMAFSKDSKTGATFPWHKRWLKGTTDHTSLFYWLLFPVLCHFSNVFFGTEWPILLWCTVKLPNEGKNGKKNFQELYTWNIVLVDLTTPQPLNSISAIILWEISWPSYVSGCCY